MTPEELRKRALEEALKVPNTTLDAAVAKAAQTVAAVEAFLAGPKP